MIRVSLSFLLLVGSVQAMFEFFEDVHREVAQPVIDFVNREASGPINDLVTELGLEPVIQGARSPRSQSSSPRQPSEPSSPRQPSEPSSPRQPTEASSPGQSDGESSWEQDWVSDDQSDHENDEERHHRDSDDHHSSESAHHEDHSDDERSSPNGRVDNAESNAERSPPNGRVDNANDQPSSEHQPERATEEAAVCAICQGVYKDPQLLQPCNHMLCSSCLRGLKRRHHTECPKCRATIQSHFPIYP